ncbi:MAG: ABC transporter permease subunit [Halobacteriota archaeon]
MNILGLTYRAEKTFIVFYLISAIFLALVLAPVLNVLLSHNLQELTLTAQQPRVYNAIVLSVYSAFLASMIALVLGVPLAYVLARKNFAGKSAIEALVDLPLVVPHTVAGIAILLVWGKNGVFGAPMNDIFGLTFYGTLAGIVVAMLFVSSPFMINAAREGFESINPDLELAARTLGASQIEVFRRVSLPLAFRGIMVGILLTWARSLSEFGAVYIIAYYPQTAPILISEAYLEFGLKESSAIAALLLVVTLTVFIVLRLLTLRRKKEK